MFHYGSHRSLFILQLFGRLAEWYCISLESCSCRLVSASGFESLTYRLWYISLIGKAPASKTGVAVKGFIGSSPICTAICLHVRVGLRGPIGNQVGCKRPRRFESCCKRLLLHNYITTNHIGLRVRVVYGASLLRKCVERHREFESLRKRLCRCSEEA